MGCLIGQVPFCGRKDVESAVYGSVVTCMPHTHVGVLAFLVRVIQIKHKLRGSMPRGYRSCSSTIVTKRRRGQRWLSFI